MLPSDTIYNCIEAIAATPGKNDKLAMLKRHMEDAQFKRVCEYAYNPFKTYGIAKRPELIGANSVNTFDAGTWELLDDLISRKLTGNAAIEAVRGEMTALDKDSSELFWRIVKKDLRAGFSESSCNKVSKGMIPEFPYMRCSLPKGAKLNEFDWANGVVSQEKADGMFANVNVETDSVNITSRQGTPFPLDEMSDLVNTISQLAPGHQYHGELLVLKDNEALPRQIGNGMLNAILDGGIFEEGCYPVFMVWDKIPLASVVPKGKCETPYKKRLASAMLDVRGIKSNVRIIPTRVVKSLAEAYEHYRELLKMKKEGTIVKDGAAIWKDGTSKQQVKLKLKFQVDLKITGYEAGNGKNAATFGSVMTETSCGQLKVSVSGFTDAMRQHIHENSLELLETIMTVEANDIMKPSESNEFHSLFLPVYAELRKDKLVADDLERVFSQREAAIEAA